MSNVSSKDSMIASVASLSPPAAAALAVLERYKADVVTPLRLENERLREVLAEVKLKAVSLADAQVIALLALRGGPETEGPQFSLGPTTDAWRSYEHWELDAGPGKVTCHSRVVDGVLCRWWGDGAAPGGVSAINRAAETIPKPEKCPDCGMAPAVDGMFHKQGCPQL